jgi:hypothetical protein
MANEFPHPFPGSATFQGTQQRSPELKTMSTSWTEIPVMLLEPLVPLLLATEWRNSITGLLHRLLRAQLRALFTEKPFAHAGFIHGVALSSIGQCKGLHVSRVFILVRFAKRRKRLYRLLDLRWGYLLSMQV